MSIEYKYKDIEWCQSCFHKSDDCFFDSNIIVPDSMDDIAKIIAIKAYPSVSDSKAEDNRITVNGNVKVNVLYIGENETGKICTLTTSVPFSNAITAAGTDSDCITIVTPGTCALSHTLINSRKLKLSAQLGFFAVSYKNMRLNVLCQATGAETKAVERIIPSARSICTKNLVITESAELAQGKAPISRILKHNAHITEKDFKVLNNKVIVKGSITVNILYLAEDTVTDCSITVPFTEVVEAEGISPDQKTNMSLSISDCEINPDTDLSGEYRMIEAGIIMAVGITSFAEEQVSFINDIYCPGSILKTSAASISVRNSFSELHEEEFIKESVTLTKGMPSIQRVIDSECNLAGVSISDGVCTATGEITILYQSTDASSEVNTFTAKLPITHKLSSKNAVLKSCLPGHMSYAITSDDTLEIRMNIDFSLIDGENETFSVYTECTEEEYTPEECASVIVSFVNKNETLWDIAKKHNISVSKLALANAIDENATVTKKDKLIIPR